VIGGELRYFYVTAAGLLATEYADKQSRQQARGEKQSQLASGFGQ